MSSDESRPQEQKPDDPAIRVPTTTSAVTAGAVAPAPAVETVPPAVANLTPEEQMALFEKELKEKDWGHQPC